MVANIRCAGIKKRSCFAWSQPIALPFGKGYQYSPPHPTLRQVMVANIRCAEIKDDQLRNLTSDQAWQRLSEQAASGAVVPGFGSAAFALTDSCTKG